MRSRSVVIACLAAGLAGRAPLAAEEAFALLPPDAKAVIGVNVGRIAASDLGQKLSAHLKTNASLRRMTPAGFDPLRDLKEIIIAGRPEQNRRGLVIVTGVFPKGVCDQIASTTPGVSSRTVQGVKLFTRKEDKDMAVACLDETLILIGDPVSIGGALTRRSRPGPAADPALVEKARQLRSARDIWLVADGSGLSALAPGMGGKGAKPANGPQLQMLESLRQLSGGITLGANIEIAVDLATKTENDAATMAGGLRLIAGMATQQNKNTPPQVTEILKSLQLRAEGDTVKLALSIPQDELVRGVQSAFDQFTGQIRAGLGGGAPATARRPARRQPAPPPPDGGIKVYSSDKDMGVVTLPAPK